MNTKTVILTVVAIGCSAVIAFSGGTHRATGDYSVVDTEGLQALINSGEKFVLIDARAGKWDDGRRIADARQLAPDAPAEAIEKTLPNKDAKIVAYCSNKKCPASANLLHKLASLGYENLVKYPDGIQGWTDSGNEVKN